MKTLLEVLITVKPLISCLPKEPPKSASNKVKKEWQDSCNEMAHQFYTDSVANLKNQYLALSTAETERDFVEAVSQFRTKYFELSQKK